MVVVYIFITNRNQKVHIDRNPILLVLSDRTIEKVNVIVLTGR